ncbi:MAG: RNA polymerase sigma factor [Bacteroidia bacterium]|nr:RNA polymerase sigma factor [Bacteroidia bacterium]
MAVIQEQELLLQLKQEATRKRAFDSLIRNYQQMLYYHIRRMVISHEDADDVLQNTLLKAWKNIERFRGDSALKTWLYRIATNESLTFLNKRKKMSQTAVENIENDMRHSLHGGSYVSGDEIERKLQAAIGTLPDRQRLVFNMRYFDEMKYDEISEALEVSVGALKASFHHAVKKIEKYLEETND